MEEWAIEPRAWVAVVGDAVVAAAGTVISSVEESHPPGPLFLLFGFGAGASVPHGLALLTSAALLSLGKGPVASVLVVAVLS